MMEDRCGWWRRHIPFGRYFPSECRLVLFLALLTGLIAGFSGGFGTPILLVHVVQKVFSTDALSPLQLLYYCALPIALVSIRALAGLANTYLLASVGQEILATIRQRICGKLHRLPLQFFFRAHVGDLISRAFNDTSVIQSSFVSIAHEILQRPIMMVSAVAAVTFLCLRQAGGWMLLLILILVAMSGLIILRIGRLIWGRSRITQERIAELTTEMANGVRAAQEVRAFCMERRQVRAFAATNREYTAAYLRACRSYYLIVPSIEIWAIVGISLATVCAYYLRVPGGTFLAIGTALYLTYDPIKNLGRLYGNLQYTFAALTRIEEFLAEPEPAETTGETEPIRGRLRGEITFSNVSFAYDDGITVLHGINANLTAGRSYALVGPNGAGKTTLANLIPKFFEPQRGKIAIDGMDIARMNAKQLRSQIAYVPQRPTLAHDTVAGNIRWGKPHATREEIVEAARRTGSLEFIERLPQGMATVVGEDGSYLSGGQRQRIALARALLRDAPILILDEPTNSLDSRSEREIREILPDLFRDRTVLLISHRFQWLPHVDEILVLDGGRIVDRGTHGELLRREGLYRHLHALHTDTP
jgi:subfamily B ATP-binding cassette protein MsbA